MTAQKKKVLTIIRHPVGGIRTYLKYTYGSLDEQKYEFTIVTAMNKEGRIILKDLEKFPVELVEVRGKYLLAKMVGKILSMLKGGRRWNLIHSQGFTAGVVGVLANTFSHTPHVITSHDVFRQDQFSGLRGFIKKKILGFLLSRADVIQSVSHDAEQNLVQYLPSLSKKPQKLAVILNGICVDEFDATALGPNGRLRRENGIGDEVILFGFFGRFMPQKGFTDLIEAVEEISKNNAMNRDFKVLAVNEGAFVREYKAIIQKRGLDDYFVFCDFLPDISGVLREVDALVMPSLWEAGSLLPMEGMVAGAPVIASECVGLREVVKDTPAILVEAGNPHSIGEGMCRFIRDELKYKETARQFIPLARARYDARLTAAKLDELFDRITGNRGENQGG